MKRILTVVVVGFVFIAVGGLAFAGLRRSSLSDVKGLAATSLPAPTILPSDLFAIIEKDPSWSENSCVDFHHPGDPVNIKGLDGAADQYAVPYYKDGNICRVYGLRYEAGKWVVIMESLWDSRANGNRYPPATAEDAKAYIEQMTCQKVTAPPFFAIADKYLDPFWYVETIEGNAFYVSSAYGQVEADTPPILHLWAVKAGEDHRMWIKPEACH